MIDPLQESLVKAILEDVTKLVTFIFKFFRNLSSSLIEKIASLPDTQITTKTALKKASLLDAPPRFVLLPKDMKSLLGVASNLLLASRLSEKNFKMQL